MRTIKFSDIIKIWNIGAIHVNMRPIIKSRGQTIKGLDAMDSLKTKSVTTAEYFYQNESQTIKVGCVAGDVTTYGVQRILKVQKLLTTKMVNVMKDYLLEPLYNIKNGVGLFFTEMIIPVSCVVTRKVEILRQTILKVLLNTQSCDLISQMEGLYVKIVIN